MTGKIKKSNAKAKGKKKQKTTTIATTKKYKKRHPCIIKIKYSFHRSTCFVLNKVNVQDVDKLIKN